MCWVRPVSNQCLCNQKFKLTKKQIPLRAAEAAADKCKPNEGIRKAKLTQTYKLSP